MFLMVNAMLKLSHAAKTFGPSSVDSPRESNRASCVETYGITLTTSELYVREWSLGAPANNPNKSPELSTLLRGMAHNGCGENLKNVRIRFVVHDDDRRKGDGFYLIESMAIGESKSFERAWMGRVTSYEVTADR
jgi:hypothetical protein